MGAPRQATEKLPTKAVGTAWSLATGTASDVFSLWGMADLGAPHAATYVLSLSFHPTGLASDKLNAGKIALVTRGEKGDWINAVDANVGGAKKFVFGAYQPTFGLGTYGINASTNTAWAVLNRTGDFAVTAVP